MKKSLCLLFLVFAFSALWAQNSGKKVTVTGLVGEMVTYGAPGYGENPEEDDIESFLSLFLIGDKSVMGKSLNGVAKRQRKWC